MDRVAFQGCPLSARGFIRPSRPAISARRAPRCNAISNIERLPMEPIPESGSLPSHWGTPGVYGVYDAKGSLQYVAAVQNVLNALETHRMVLKDPNRVHSVRMITVPNVEDAPLGQLAENWVMTHTAALEPPPGNIEEESQWRFEIPVPTGPDLSFAEGSTEADTETEIMRILRQNRLVLFMKGKSDYPMCGFSRLALGILQGIAGSDLKVVDCLDAAKNPGLRDGIKQFAQWPTIPQFYVNGDFVGGCDIVQSMAESGELHALIEPVLAESPTYTGN